MKTILILAEKGGVGKTMIADELAFSFERSGIPVAFYEIDRQGGELHASVSVPDAEVNLVDTPGYALEGRDAWINDADLVVIPTVPGGNSEMQPFISTLVACHEQGKKVAVILNKKTMFNSSKELKKALEELPFEVDVLTIPLREDYVKASLRKMSIMDYRQKSDAAKQLQKTLDIIRTMAGFGPEERKG